MTKVEQDKQESQEALKKEIKQQVEVDIRRSARKKKLFRCCSCFIIFIAFIGALVFGAAWVVAKTGLCEVPYVSSWAFKAPESLHEVVVPKSYDGASSFEDFGATLGHAQSQISIKEEMLNALLLDQLIQPLSETGLDVERAQIAVESEGMEIFLHLARDEKVNIYLSIIAMPKIDGNRIGFDVVSVRLGNLGIPDFIAGPVISSFLGSALGALELPMVGLMELKEIKLNYGEIVLQGE
ncbi:hypothetical protein KJ969_03020 [Patescibacteria group bacterium]|nr:hypothetical protein [Patescibacteria group bacterium]MBU1921943.1 hypothetical protein [Patescibacteria group bacterium]